MHGFYIENKYRRDFEVSSCLKPVLGKALIRVLERIISAREKSMSSQHLSSGFLSFFGFPILLLSSPVCEIFLFKSSCSLNCCIIFLNAESFRNLGPSCDNLAGQSFPRLKRRVKQSSRSR